MRCILHSSIGRSSLLHNFTAIFSISTRMSIAGDAKNPLRSLLSSEESGINGGKKKRNMAMMMSTGSGEENSSNGVDNRMKESFEKYAKYLDDLNEKRERVVKASRDVTINSKKVIFQTHRLSKYNKEEILEKAEKDLSSVTNQNMARLVNELQGCDFWKLRRAYSPGVQEYVEAATFYKFCKSGTLLTLAEINRDLFHLSKKFAEPLEINIFDYVLGIADLTGELMRLAISRISDGELDYAKEICNFVRDIYRNLTLMAPLMDDSSDMKKKMETMLQSVIKIENACFNVHVRGSEYIPLLGSEDADFSMFGMADYDL